MFAKIFGSSDIGSSSTRDIESVPNNIVLFINQAAVISLDVRLQPSESV